MAQAQEKDKVNIDCLNSRSSKEDLYCLWILRANCTALNTMMTVFIELTTSNWQSNSDDCVTYFCGMPNTGLPNGGTDNV